MMINIEQIKFEIRQKCMEEFGALLSEKANVTTFLDHAHLYHYTNGIGLCGILESDCLWATNLSFVNDAQEIKYGRSKCEEIIRTLQRSKNGDSRYDFVLSTLLAEITAKKRLTLTQLALVRMGIN